MGFLIITLIANFLENLSVKNIDNRLRFDEVTRKSLVSPFLWDSVYKKLSYYRGTARVRCVSWDFVKDWANVRKTALKNVRNRWMAFGVIQRIGSSQLDTSDFLLVFHCNYVRISCMDIDTYMTKFLKRSRDTDHALFGGCLSSRSSHFIWPISVQITKFEVVSLCRYI